jgi:hypothetical protein
VGNGREPLRAEAAKGADGSAENGVVGKRAMELARVVVEREDEPRLVERGLA